MSLIQHKSRTVQRDENNPRLDSAALKVEYEVNHWITQVKDLYSFIKGVLADSNIEFKTSTKIEIYEREMKEHDISPKDVPILDLYRDKNLIATFKPLGLWVIGGRAKIDVLTKKGGFILTDTGNNEAQPEWKVLTSDKNNDFDKKFILELVNPQ